MPSDKEYVEKIIRNYDRRKKRAALFGVTSIVLASFMYFAYATLTEKVNEVTSSVSSTLIEGRALTETNIELVKVNNELSYVLGLRVGHLPNTIATGAGLSLGHCLYLLFSSRKERIIKELYEKARL
jgi:hypothetical protein